MKVLIITGGTIDDAFAVPYIRDRQWDKILSADAGMNFCKRNGIMPDLIMGDFDSADPLVYAYYKDECPEKILVFPAEKDETDTELVLWKAIEIGADEIAVIGGTGTRMDHVLGNLQLLRYAMEAGVDCYLVDANNRIRMIDKTFSIRKTEQFGKYVSLVPFTEQVTGLTLEGFVYTVEDFTLCSGKARGISNEIQQDTATIRFRDGILYVIESRDE